MIDKFPRLAARPPPDFSLMSRNHRHQPRKAPTSTAELPSPALFLGVMIPFSLSLPLLLRLPIGAHAHANARALPRDMQCMCSSSGSPGWQDVAPPVDPFGVTSAPHGERCGRTAQTVRHPETSNKRATGGRLHLGPGPGAQPPAGTAVSIAEEGALSSLKDWRDGTRALAFLRKVSKAKAVSSSSTRLRGFKLCKRHDTWSFP